MKKDCTKPCFSNGSECSAWIGKNCDNCVKGSRYNAKNNTYTKIRCTIQEDIFTQYLGKGNDAIRQKSYDATRHNGCPYIVPLGTPRPKRYKVTLEQQTLFELEILLCASVEGNTNRTLLEAFGITMKKSCIM